METPTEVMQIARELLRRRVLTQQKDGQNDLMNALSQATLLHKYGRLPTLEDLKFNKNYLDFVTHDEQERSVRVVATKGDWSHRIWSNMLWDADVFVFARFDERTNSVSLDGWMPRLEIEDSSFEWWEIEGKRVSYFHTVDEQAFLSMPDTFDFEPPSCQHGDKLVGAWDDRFGAWRCVFCDRILYDTIAQERLGYLYGRSESGASNQVAAST